MIGEAERLIFGAIGVAIPSFLVAWAIVALCKPRTWNTFDAAALIPILSLNALAFLGAMQEEYSDAGAMVLRGILGVLFAWLPLRLIYKSRIKRTERADGDGISGDP